MKLLSHLTRSLPNWSPSTSGWITFVILISILLSFLNPIGSVEAAPVHQATTPMEQAQARLNDLSPEERVGQLFLATFQGIDVDTDSQINDLIANYHIGGVIILARNDNFTADPDELDRIFSMNRQLQLIRWSASQQTRITPSGDSFTPTFVPLFITLSQEGDGYPYDQILNGLTPLPNEMAMGATWNPELVSQVGNVLGQELSVLGLNLLLGPSLDVLETPNLEGGSGLGTRTFGGDPFWVGKLGQAYISGIHRGSAGRIAVVAKHFPGNGGACQRRR